LQCSLGLAAPVDTDGKSMMEADSCKQSQCSYDRLMALYDKAVGELPSLIRTPYLPEGEKSEARAAGLDLVYGAVPPAGLRKVFNDTYLNGTGNYGGKLADLGHGAGQVSLYAYLHFSLREVVGIEYSMYRFNVSCIILERIAQHAKAMGITFNTGSAIHFLQGDFTKVPIPLHQFPMTFMETNLSTALEPKMRKIIESQMSVNARVMTFNKMFTEDKDMYHIPDDTGVITSWAPKGGHFFHFWQKMYEPNPNPNYDMTDDSWMDSVPAERKCSLVDGVYKGTTEFPAELIDPSHR